MTNITSSLRSNSELINQVTPTIKVDTMCGMTHVSWDNSQAFTPVGQLVFFSQFLTCSKIFKDWVDDAPLSYKSNNAPETKDILGTLLLSVLSGHKRYTHMNEIAGDEVSAEILDLNKICSEDSTRRAIKRMDEGDALNWLNRHLKNSWEPMTEYDWILDIDSTVKPVFGHQEGAKIGYNPAYKGRPSYSYHSYFIANIRICLGVEVRSGNEHGGSFALPKLFELIDSMAEENRPFLIRGDVSYGSDNMMKECEARLIRYLFKLKMTSGPKNLIRDIENSNPEWVNAGQGWQGHKSTIRLQGWEQQRDVLILRRQHKSKKTVVAKAIEDKQPTLFPEILEDEKATEWEYCVLVTNLNRSVLEITQHYRDRGDCENNYDENKNQWGWGGFTTQDLASTRIMASLVALISNWWNVYTRLAIPEKHAEAITSRPLLLDAVGIMVKTSRQRFVRLCSSNAAFEKIAKITQEISAFLTSLAASQLDFKQRWRAIIQQAFILFRRPQLATAIESRE
jgi:hypothetical protein